jgi:hypothetical protein
LIVADSKVFSSTSDSSYLKTPKRAELKGGSATAAQIEQLADYFSPKVYQALKFYSDFEATDDSSSAWVPVSQTKANPKIFAVGIIPPAVTLSGRLLDRSASVATSTDDVAGEAQFMIESDRGSTSKGVISGVHVAAQDGLKGAELPDSFWQSYLEMCDRLKVDPIEMAAVLSKESHFNPAAQNFAGGRERPPVAQGLCQFVRKTAMGAPVNMKKEEWETFALLSASEQLVYVERFFSGRVAGKDRYYINKLTFGGHDNPDGSVYASKESMAAWISSHPGDTFDIPEQQDKAIRQNPGVVTDGRILRSTLDAQVVKHPPTEIIFRLMGVEPLKGATSSRTPVIEGEDDLLGDLDSPEVLNWQEQGSANASEARRKDAKLGSTGLNNTTETGKRFLFAQQAEIKQTALELETMRNTPPLRLLVNPTSLRVSCEKLASDGNWTRNGPIVEHWGENQDKIEGSGKVAAFFAIDANTNQAGGQGEGPGLTRVSRQYSASYQNFMSLYLLYRNNANLYTSGLDLADSKGAFRNRLSMVGSIYLYYDATLYVGSFDNFSITESDTAPYTLEYNFQFTARATFILDQPPVLDPQAQAFVSPQQGYAPTTRSYPGMEEFSEVQNAFADSIFAGDS